MLLVPFFLIVGAQANIFDFFQQQFHGQQGNNQPSTEELEAQLLNEGCSNYFCSDTRTCADSPNDCPCPYPSSQLRCVLPNGEYMCISKPAGDISEKYSDPSDNFNIDAGGDVRDCGWVKRAWEGLV